MPSVPRLLASVLFVGFLVAQQPAPLADAPTWTREQVLAKLGSDEPRDIAWAAHFAGENAMRDAVPGLRSALARLVAPHVHGVRARLHVLDALLRLDARLAADELLPHASGDLRVPALLLAARDPEANREYFAARMLALVGAEDLEWRVCGNLLAARPRPGFAAHCLAQLVFTMTVRVDDDEHDGICRCGVGCGSPVFDPPPHPVAFPPAVYYALDPDNATCRSRTGFACVAWQRRPVPAGGMPDVAGCDGQRAWRDWLTPCGGERTAAACAETGIEVTWKWRGLARLRGDVQKEQRQRERAFAAMVVELTKAGELTAEQAARARFACQLDLIDIRGKPTKPLPKPSELLLPQRTD